MNFCESILRDYNPRLCGIEFAGVVGVGLININESPDEDDLQDVDFWLGKISQTNPKYFALRNTRGEYQGGAQIDEEDLIGSRVIGAEHEASFDSTGIEENWEYWNYITRHLWKACLVTSAGLLLYIDKPVSIYTKVINAKSVKTQAFYQSFLKWHDLSNPVILEAPEGIFFGDEPVSGAFDFRITNLGFRTINTGEFRIVIP